MIMVEALKKLKNSFFAVLPIAAVIFILQISKVSDFNKSELVIFGISAVLVVLGMCLFNIGAESSMQKMGELVGSSATKKKSIAFLIIIFFLFGVFITVAEPDLSVLAQQAANGSRARIALIISIGVGVGVFLVVGAIRILFQKSLKVWLLGFYGLMFAVCCLVDYARIPLSLDSGGVTTGPITVPFILSVGIGIASSRAGNKSDADSFGLVAFSSIGPILVVLILSLFMRNTSQYDVSSLENEISYSYFFEPFIKSLIGFNGTLFKVAISTLPILIFFIVYELLFIKLSSRKLLGLVLGVLLVYFGLVLFLTSVEAGFLPIGQKLGKTLGLKNTNIFVLVGAVLGLAAAFAEPAVHVLTNQVEAVSEGAVSKIAVLLTIALGNAFAIGFSMLRVKLGFNLLWIIVPGYTLAFILSFIVPDIYSAIAFDAGGVVSGPMNSTFILPFAIGACYAINGAEASSKIMTDAFGTIGVVALMPLLMIQILGLSGTIRIANERKIARHRTRAEFDNQIIHF